MSKHISRQGQLNFSISKVRTYGYLNRALSAPIPINQRVGAKKKLGSFLGMFILLFSFIFPIYPFNHFAQADLPEATGNLTVTHTVINDNGGIATVNDFDITVEYPIPFGTDTFHALTSITFPIPVGEYSVYLEAGPDGYTTTSCSGEMTENGNATCNIVSTDDPGVLNIKKVVVGGEKAASDFTINITAIEPSQSSIQGSSSFTTVTADTGEYSIDEEDSMGYTKTLSEDCSGTVALGQIKNCTITNTWEEKPAPEPTGSIRICKVVTGPGETGVNDGSFASGTVFQIAGIDPENAYAGAPAGVLPLTNFPLPLELNADLFSEIEGNDAYCVTYNDLPYGIYYYGQETISTSTHSGWYAPEYNDNYALDAYNPSSNFPYSAQYYSEGEENPNYHASSDGVILVEDRDAHPTLVVYNQAYDREDQSEEYVLNIQFSGEGEGVVTSEDGLINCDSQNPESDCSETYSSSMLVTLTAAAKEGSSFSGTWHQACEGAGQNPQCQVTVDGNKTAEAHFVLKGENVCVSNCSTPSSGGGGSGGGGIPTRTSQVLGISTTTPFESLAVPQVLGAATELPRTGIDLSFWLISLFGLLAFSPAKAKF